jgi:hypothetical protein
MDSLTAVAVDGAWFRYTHSVNGGRFEAVTRSNSVETVADTGITVAASTTYRLEVRANAAGTSVEFRINGGLVATITANIPTAVGRETGFAVLALRTAGTAALTAAFVDYMVAEQSFAGGR